MTFLVGLTYKGGSPNPQGFSFLTSGKQRTNNMRFLVCSFPGNVWRVLRLGLVDDFNTFRIEPQGSEFFEFLAA